MNNDPNARTSFFDDDDLNIRFEFRKPAKIHQKELNQPPMLKNMLIKQVPNSSNEQSGYYALHNNLLALYKSNSYKAVDVVLELAHAKVKLLPPATEEQNIGFAVFKNGNTYEFYSPDAQIIEDWLAALKGVCVLTNFHEEYKALKMIGKGSFAKVYLVEAKTSGKMFAVKAFTKESVIASNKANAKPSMLNEIEIMRALDHENIIKLYEVHESEKSIYLVLELIQGKSMQDVLKRPSFREEYSEVKVVNMIRSILDALAYLASKGIMHRDLKPDNILIDKDLKVKIADFGLATFCDVPEYIFKKCGTPGYIAPEVFKYDQKVASTNYDYQCDAFSAGCILYYMLFGHPFFEASDASQILRMNRKFTNEFDALSTIKIELRNSSSKISKDGLNLLAQLLDIDPAKRMSAEQSLSHPYFIPVPSGMLKLSGTNDLVADNKSNPSSPFTPKKNSQRHNTFSPEQVQQFIANGSPQLSKNVIKERFAEKDSLYLDMGKPDFNGKTDTLNTATSNNNSLLIQKRDSHLSIGSNDSASSFKKSAEKRSKSFRIHNTPGGGTGGNQSFLKAALLRQMQKNNSDMPGEENKDDNLLSPQGQRGSARLNGYSSERSRDSQDNDSEEESSPSPKLKPSKNEKSAPNSPLKTSGVGVSAKRRFQPFASKADTQDPK